MKRTLSILLGLGLAFATGLIAADEGATQAIRAALAKALNVPLDNVQPSAAPGLLEVVRNHDFSYVTADGKWQIEGDLTNLQTGEHVTENHRRADRLAALRQLGDDNSIVFAPASPRYTVTVFTDIDCPYCRKLHGQIREYNARGIAVRYVFFPRTGLNTPSYDKAVSVWCADDRRTELTRAKLGEPLPRRHCDNPVAREYQLAIELGVRGTPSIFLPNGDAVPGYATPDELLSVLQEDEAEAKTAEAANRPKS